MNNVMLNSATMGVVISLMGFFVGILCREKFKLPIFNPLLIAIILRLFLSKYSMSTTIHTTLPQNTSVGC